MRGSDKIGVAMLWKSVRVVCGALLVAMTIAGCQALSNIDDLKVVGDDAGKKPTDGGADGSCSPSKKCGDPGAQCGSVADGCGTVQCGSCPTGQLCNQGSCTGQAFCGNKACDPGESCTACTDCACPAPTVCVSGACCTPSCEGKQCGDNGCAGQCGSCPSGSQCDLTGHCVNQPSCGNGSCEPGLGETCTGCPDCSCVTPAKCTNGVCCTPNCSGKNCGDDGCGGACGNFLGGPTLSLGGNCRQAVFFG